MRLVITKHKEQPMGTVIFTQNTDMPTEDFAPPGQVVVTDIEQDIDLPMAFPVEETLFWVD